MAANLNIKDITDGKYYAKGIYGVVPMANGESYTQLSSDNKQIIRYSFVDGKKQEVVFDVATAKKVKLESIDGYIMSPDESRILIQTETEKRYRHSFTATYYIYSVKNKTLEPLSDGGKQEAPLFSPDGNLIAFVRKNNLYLVKLLFNNSESQITKDGEWNKIINGVPDWVNEEEFTYYRAFDFSADSKMLAWIRYDETNVPEFAFPLYKGSNPEHEEYAIYPGEYSYKYPMAGETNSTVQVLTFDIQSKVTRTMQVPLSEEGYIPRIQFTQDPTKLAIITLNRDQNNMELYYANPRSTECKLILRNTDDRYVGESAYENLLFLKDHFVMMSEKSGYNHLYYYTLNGQLVKQLTSGEFVVTDLYGANEQTGEFYFASNEGSPLRQHIWKVDTKGKKTRLSSEEGTHNAIFSTGCKYYMDTFSNVNTPTLVSLHNNSGKQLKVMEDNAALKEKLKDVTMGKREFFTFTTSEGVKLNGWILKPANFDASKKYPVLMFQYSGPGSQQVLDKWNIGNCGGGMYEEYLAQQGILSVCIDGRGTGGRGADFEKCTYLNLGDLESKDQVEGAIYLASLPYVDKDRIAIWGWSFGGFNTLMSMSEGREVFKAGVAVAPPTKWRFYDTIYTERYMRTPKQNPNGYNNGPIAKAAKLHGALLICHGLADDNVHFRNTAEYSEALVQADKDFGMQVYTNRNHNIFGGNTRNHLYRKLTTFIKTQFGM
jgi:dipeptidyl-peptidase-4